MISFLQVQSEQHKGQARELISEYLEWLNERVQRDYNLHFDIEAMIRSDLTDMAKFEPPYGRFYLAYVGEEAAGVGCLKKLDEAVGEIQRMYVLQQFRGKGLGRAIVDLLIADARVIGYRQLRLESLEFLTAAHALYKSVGFHEIDPYAGNGMNAYHADGTRERYRTMTVFMELDLVEN